MHLKIELQKTVSNSFPLRKEGEDGAIEDDQAFIINKANGPGSSHSEQHDRARKRRESGTEEMSPLDVTERIQRKANRT